MHALGGWATLAVAAGVGSGLVSDRRLPSSLVVANAKGGVGKTTITAHLAISAAARGHDVVAVDLDPQGNLTTELGIASGEGDGGRSLAAMAAGALQRPALVATSRTGLRCLPGGPGTTQFVRAARRHRGEHGMREVLIEALGPLVAGGATLFIDTHGAAATPLAGVALELAQWALIPTKLDRDSFAGVSQVVAQLGPTTARPAGVVMFDVNPRATRALGRARERLCELLEARAPVLEATIRHADRAQQEAKECGLVAAEYAALSGGRAGRERRDRALAASAARLAGDYAALASELEQLMKEPVAV